MYIHYINYYIDFTPFFFFKSTYSFDFLHIYHIYTKVLSIYVWVCLVDLYVDVAPLIYDLDRGPTETDMFCPIRSSSRSVLCWDQHCRFGLSSTPTGWSNLSVNTPNSNQSHNHFFIKVIYRL